VDADGNAWLAGSTGSANATTTPDAFDRQFNGGASDAYIAKLNRTGSALLHATFLGGSNSEGGGGVVLDSGGNVYVTGHTYSADFPTTPGAFDRVFGGDPFIFWGDAFVTRLAVGSASPPPPPPPPSAPSLSSLAVNPSSVVGGNASTGTVTLTSAAPTGGAPVSLSSSNAGVASLPAAVAVAAGATSATFTVTTTTVAAVTPVTISAAYNGVTRTATLTVAPAGSGPLPAPSLLSPANGARFPPGQSITFDWSDVAGASSYTIQVDDGETFSAPLLVNETVGASQFTASTLPTRRMCWRVRANDSSGAPGTWSGARRFELKD
jgi:hypothetical protein